MDQQIFHTISTFDNETSISMLELAAAKLAAHCPPGWDASDKCPFWDNNINCCEHWLIWLTENKPKC